MKLLMMHPCEPSVNGWMKGDFLDNLMLMVWAKEDGRAFVYKLSATSVPLILGGGGGAGAPLYQGFGCKGLIVRMSRNKSPVCRDIFLENIPLPPEIYSLAESYNW